MSRKANADNKEINPFIKLVDAYGGLDRLPDSFKPNIQIDTTNKNLLGVPSLTVDSRYKFAGVGDDEEVRAIPGIGGETQFEVVGKGAPRIGLGRVFAGMLDPLIPGDFDKRDNRRLIDLKDPKNFELSKIEQNIVKDQLESAGIEKTEDDPFDDAEKRLDFYEKNADRINKLSRDRSRSASIDSTLQYAATEPLRQAFANRAAEAAAQRGLRIRAAKEAMPSNIQNIMLSKQAQAATASSAEAERARAAADQQDAASRFASLGMQRRFG
tara:strand:+ start:612 stop:1421 length:810 start_codon:yes stop_codon:yes gene_type:complete